MLKFSRHAIRSTWIMPCKVSVHCDYKFFVDAAPTTLKKMPELLSESFTYDDMVFRNSCSLMQRHPEYVNYGNAPPVGNNLFRYDKSSSEEENMDKIPNPDYVFRRMYKIDWKVCMCFAFLIFAVFQKKKPLYAFALLLAVGQPGVLYAVGS